MKNHFLFFFFFLVIFHFFVFSFESLAKYNNCNPFVVRVNICRCLNWSVASKDTVDLDI